MARLPSYQYLIQQIGGVVILFEDGSEREIVRFDPSSQDSTAKAQKVIHDSELSDEDKCYAHLWSGYFYAHATGLVGDVPQVAIPALSFSDWLDVEYPDGMGSGTGGRYISTDLEAAFQAGRRLGPDDPASHGCVLCSSGIGEFCACLARCSYPGCKGPSEGS